MKSFFACETENYKKPRLGGGLIYMNVEQMNKELRMMKYCNFFCSTFLVHLFDILLVLYRQESIFIRILHHLGKKALRVFHLYIGYFIFVHYRYQSWLNKTPVRFYI